MRSDLVDVDEGQRFARAAAAASVYRSRATFRRHACAAGRGRHDRPRRCVLQISIYEVGSALFGSRVGVDGVHPGNGIGRDLPPVTVGRDGRITLPWTGRINARGKTPDDLAEELTQAYHRSSENPQVMVSIRENVNNTVIIQGDVKKPGRMPLTLARREVLDAIAIAGGSSNPGLDSIVKVNRADQSAEAPLSAIEPGRTTISSSCRRIVYRSPSGPDVHRPGCFGQGLGDSVPELPGFPHRGDRRGGGPTDERPIRRRSMSFGTNRRNMTAARAPRARPVAHRLNMRRPESYFLAQRFEMRPRTLSTWPTRALNIPTKAIQVLSLFFSPFYTAKVLSR